MTIVQQVSEGTIEAIEKGYPVFVLKSKRLPTIQDKLVLQSGVDKEVARKIIFVSNEGMMKHYYCLGILEIDNPVLDRQ